ncbi:hypothetical protein C8R44DRAFT_869920 [Mycena epipterygia]|nr:hypothetical protein C8R44DRAFT_869920 [Mycena epipterygia]
MSATQWAATEEGRSAFRSQFVIKDETGKWSELTTAAGQPIDTLVISPRPSKKWREATLQKLQKLFTDTASYNIYDEDGEIDLDLPELRGIQAKYLVQLSILEGDPVDSEDAETDAALTKNFAALQSLCVKVNILRRQNPPPSEGLWAPVLNEIIDLASKNWESLFEVFRGKPPDQAMPRRFARSPEDVPYDAVGLPRTFKPDRVLQLPRKITPGFENDRQFCCLTATKKIRQTGTATFPAVVAEFKAHRADLSAAQGQTMYSAIQAAGIFQNANSDAQVLTLAIAQGFVYPQGACWPGKLQSNVVGEVYLQSLRKADVCLIKGPPIDLGELSGVIGFFLLVRHAVKTSVEAAFKISDLPGGRPLHERLKIPAERPPPMRITPGPLVEWRARTLPKFLTPIRKRKRDEKAANTVSKRQRTSQATAADDEENE